VRLLDASLPCADRARERAANMAEQFRLERVSGIALQLSATNR
jgi:hypothetical protein